MKYLLTLFFALFAVVIAGRAQWVQTAGPSGGAVVQLVTNPSNGYVFAIAGGNVYRSTDAGASWTPRTNGLQANIGANTIAVSGSSVYIGLGAGNTPNLFYRSTDNGDTWTIPSGTGIPSLYLPSLMTVSGPRLLMFATYLLGGSKLYASTDAGDTWSESMSGLPSNYAASSFVFKGSDLYAGSSNASPTKGIYKSTDNGASWSPTAFSSTLGIAGMASNSGAVFASTGAQGVYRSTDDGGSWTKINPDNTTNYGTALAANSSNLFVSAGGYVYRADQNGNSWDSTRSGLPQATAGTAIYGLALSGTSLMIAWGGHGIYRTTNAGAGWFRSDDGIRAEKIDGIFAENGLLFAAADQDGFYRSSDHGTSWVSINAGLPVSAGWYCFARAGSDLLGGVASYQLYRSSDNGDHWVLSDSGFTLTNSFAFAVEGNTVYATGLPGVAMSTDGGASWSGLPAGYLSYEGGLDIIKDGANVMTCSNVSQHRSSDGGATWGAPMSGLPARGQSGFARIDTTLFASSSFGVYKSADHGASWTSTGFPGTVSGQCVAAGGSMLFVGTNDGVYRSTDLGGSWAAINDGLASKTGIYKLGIDDQYLYAGTTNRSVWRRPLAEITGVREAFSALPGEFSLRQNYPNPFNPATTLSFVIGHSSFVTLKVYDVLGREVATLVNETIQPGRYEAEWNASGEPSGVYFARLQAGNLRAVKPVVLSR